MFAGMTDATTPTRVPAWTLALALVTGAAWPGCGEETTEPPPAEEAAPGEDDAEAEAEPVDVERCRGLEIAGRPVDHVAEAAAATQVTLRRDQWYELMVIGRGRPMPWRQQPYAYLKER